MIDLERRETVAAAVATGRRRRTAEDQTPVDPRGGGRAEPRVRHTPVHVAVQFMRYGYVRHLLSGDERVRPAHQQQVCSVRLPMDHSVHVQIFYHRVDGSRHDETGEFQITCRFPIFPIN